MILSIAGLVFPDHNIFPFSKSIKNFLARVNLHCKQETLSWASPILISKLQSWEWRIFPCLNWCSYMEFLKRKQENQQKFYLLSFYLLLFYQGTYLPPSLSSTQILHSMSSTWILPLCFLCFITEFVLVAIHRNAEILILIYIE